jgi:hypothetical protein
LFFGRQNLFFDGENGATEQVFAVNDGLHVVSDPKESAERFSCERATLFFIKLSLLKVNDRSLK